ncbi:zinc finger protein 728 [Trichonephila clavipes]|nr:zinc finger protein 728 [Trichonephila clavipes]
MSESKELPSQEEFEYICDVCREEYGKRHKRNHRVSSLESCFQCKFCKKPFGMGFVTRKFKTIHKKETHTCEICNKTYKTEAYLKYHSLKHSNDWPCWCSTCKKGFAFPYLLEVHMRAHEDELEIECSICSAKCSSKRDLKIHNLIHSEEYKWKCKICSKSFQFVSEIKQHMREHESSE